MINNFSDSGESVETSPAACVPAEASYLSEGLDVEGGES